VQLEVAERLLAGPGDAAYGALSVLTQARAEARLLARVRRGSFRPAPKVEGAFVGLTLGPPPLAEAEMDAFVATVRLAFGRRRKTLRNSLAAGWGRERAAAVLAELGWAPARRAEELGRDDFLALHRLAPVSPKR
jgi:16S rRNA (adenine1518-N6/adenine1519-N6)-dimethyltransferase